VTEAFELPVTVAAYCDWPPSVTVLGPVSATDTVVAESVPTKTPGLAVTPQAVSRSTKNVLKIVQVRGRQFERMFFSS
jgi:hypothetical protein